MEKMSISEMEANPLQRFKVLSYEVREWRDGTIFLEAPSGEGTSIPAEALAGALAKLFRRFF